jgi:hypothetical protein
VKACQSQEKNSALVAFTNVFAKYGAINNYYFDKGRL